MKTLFKVGDIILYCNNNNGTLFSNFLTLGKIYKITSVTNYMLYLKDDSDEVRGFILSRFIKYSDRNKPEYKEMMLELVKKRLLGI